MEKIWRKKWKQQASDAVGKRQRQQSKIELNRDEWSVAYSPKRALSLKKEAKFVPMHLYIRNTELKICYIYKQYIYIYKQSVIFVSFLKATYSVVLLPQRVIRSHLLFVHVFLIIQCMCQHYTFINCQFIYLKTFYDLASKKELRFHGQNRTTLIQSMQHGKRIP